MKKIKVLLIVVILLSAGSSLNQLTAQEKTKAEKENEIRIQQKIELEKKAMIEHKKAQEDADRILDEKKESLDSLNEDLQNIQVEVEALDKAGEPFRIFGRKGKRSFAFDEPFVISPPDVDSFYGHYMGGDSERTTFDFSKAVKENTFSRDYSFDVEKTVNTVVMSVMGDCKAGEIRIKIVMPNGKNYSDIVIDEFGNLNWRKSFTISETENQDKTGEWKFQIASTNATGFFKISLQTF
jgi:hypothetical protein